MTEELVAVSPLCALIPLLGVLVIAYVAWRFVRYSKGDNPHGFKKKSGDAASKASSPLGAGAEASQTHVAGAESSASAESAQGEPGEAAASAGEGSSPEGSTEQLDDGASVGVKGKRPVAGTLVWLAIYAAVLLALAFACAAGLYADAVWKIVLFTVVDVLLASVLGHRDLCLMVRKARAGAPRLPRHLVAELGILAVVSYLSVWALECSYNDWAFQLAPKYQLMEFVISFCFISFLYFLSGRRGGGAAVGVIAMTLVGVSQYFVYLFKLAAVMPADLMVLNTALAVSGNYEYIINGGILQGAGFALAALCLLSFLVPWKREQGKGRARVRNLVSALVVAALLVGFTCLPDYAEDADIKIDSWFTYDSYKAHGFLNSFITVAQDMVVEKPEGYTAEDTHELIADEAAEYEEEASKDSDRADAQAQFQEEQPCVIAVMNETFADLSQYNQLNCGYEGPQFFNSFTDECIASGECVVSVIGGGTCNSEFEFLTNNNMAFFGQGMYPYSSYKFDNCENLAKQFNELGYTTTAIHPNFPTNWKRDVIYEKMGFGTFLSKGDFTGDDELVHNEVSDASTYDRVIELLQNDDSPQFIMDITMQNHSGYTRGGIPERYQQTYSPEGFSDDLTAQTNEYLGCIEASDSALEQFIAQLKELDRPVVVVFFGDHQPGFARDINDLMFPDESNAEHEQRIYHTSYFIWANYDVEGADRFSDIDMVSTSNLSALALEVAGVPLSDYQEALLQVRKTMPAFNLFGACDADGAWYDTDEGDEPEELSDALDLLQRAQYAHFIDKTE